MNLLKQWQFRLILSFIFLTFGILFIFPNISIYIISVFMGLFILFYYILKIVPKYKRLKNVNTEWTMWIVIESIIAICSSLLALLTPRFIIDVYIFNFNLSNILGLVLLTEGIVGIIKLCNLVYLKNLNYRPKKFLKYLYIFVILIGSYLFTNTFITNEYLSYILSGLCFLFFLVSLINTFQTKKKNKIVKEVINT